MGLVIRIDGHPGRAFASAIRRLPDGARWIFSDLDGAVVIAREDGELLREAILSPRDEQPGTFDVECLASGGVSEAALLALVGVAGLACLFGVFAAWWWGPGGLMGLVLGVCLAGGLPSVVLALGQRALDPGRDAGAEAQLERAVRFAVAHAPDVHVLPG